MAFSESKKKYLLFFLIVIANVLLRIFFAASAPFNYDEMISVKNTLLDFGHIKHEAEWDNNPPFYYYSLWVWHSMLPVSEFNSRLLSVLLVSLAIGFSFLLSSKYLNLTTGIFCALLLSFSNFLVYYSLEARAYALVLLLAVTSTLFFFRYLEKPRFISLLPLALVNFLIIYTHYIAGMVLMVQYLFMLMYHRDLIKGFMPLHTLIVAALVFLRFTKKQFQTILNYNHKEDFWLKKAGLADLWNALSSLFYHPIVAIVFLFVAAFFIFQLFQKREQPVNRFELYCFLMGICSVAFLFILGTMKAVFLDRYLVFSVPFITMLVCYRLSSIQAVGSIALVLLCALLLVFYKPSKHVETDFRSAAAVVRNTGHAGDFILINTKDNLSLFEFYYDKEKFLTVKNKDSLYRSQGLYGMNDASVLETIDFQPGRSIFLLQSYHKLSRSDNPVKEKLSQCFDQRYASSYFKGVEFTVFRIKL